ncbi:MAG: hypothetical protein COX46_04125 [bacterium (Candidatus Ratteibacteria) CG23_combo_of_CG06-09_8_20_14_all_48_7]|uniref:Carbohydrate kinase FGGY C-terminal domain-containing protein n=1 Tax=bacterium (Candidatus Ratteibacteria) CG23_combo_of_CG06-09_8_20_14_all_48_7 TaxID=2014292 RepID=A0A2G9YA76_9BACT|nr:MAG: hypothetical protein COX46_04125 [bacterium (Candidatus Ratteibacteria) CG23_combo_of_CG06-09_8_20_14_all_48_7]
MQLKYERTYKLTGEITSDYSEMSKVGLIDLQNRSYSRELLGILGIGEVIKVLPPLVESTEVCGRINKEASVATGLSDGTPVIAGLADIDACALGTGTVHPGEMCIITGTWSINEILTEEIIGIRDIFGVSLYPVPGTYLALEASATSASNLSWFIEQLLPLEMKFSKRRGKSIYEYCDHMVKSCRAEECGITFHPFLYGSDRRTDASAAFLGVKGWSSRKDMLRAVYEGIAFSHKMHVDQLRSVVGTPVSATRLAGGLSKSPVWTQILCDVLGVTLEVSTDREIGTKGCMLCGAVGVGLYKNFADAVSKSVVQKKSFKPRKDMKAYYQKKYLLFKASVEKMEPIWNLFAH